MRSSRRGVTLLEMLVVLALVSLLAGISFPAVTSGLESIRLRSASDEIVSFLHLGLTYAERREQAVELRIDRAANQISFRGASGDFRRELTLPEGITIAGVIPAPDGEASTESRVILYPGGAFPRIMVEILNRKGTRRSIRIDPVAGVPYVETPVAVGEEEKQ